MGGFAAEAVVALAVISSTNFWISTVDLSSPAEADAGSSPAEVMAGDLRELSAAGSGGGASAAAAPGSADGSVEFSVEPRCCWTGLPGREESGDGDE